jgi:hypothetical protein
MAKIITNLADVPDGWVRIADITDSVTDQKILSDAHNADVIPAVKLVRTTSEFRIGPVWVDPVAAKALLERCQAKRDGRVAWKEAADLVPAAFGRGDRDALSRMADALERMVSAWTEELKLRKGSA